MPTLKQLTAHILHGHSTVPLKEYATTYTDGTVTTYIAVPTNPAGLPVPFSVKLTSNGYIAPGLAMFVFIDGVYQCNRNREDLVWDVRREIEMRMNGSGNGKEKRGMKGRKAREKEEEERREREKERRARDVEFVVRQKEEKGADGTWVGRPWRFEEFRVVNAMPDLPDVDPQTHFAELGDIVVLVLRCVSKKDKPDADSDSDSDAPRSAMAPSFDLDDSDSESNSEADIPTPKPSKGKDEASMQATVEDAPDEDLGGLGGLFGLFDGDNTGYYGQQYAYYPYQNGQQRNWEQQPWQAQNQQSQQWNAYTQQWEPVPTQYLQVPLQYNPGYTAQPQYVYYPAPEQHSQPASAPAPAPIPVSHHNHRCPLCGNTGPHNTSSQHRSSSACQSCGNPNPPPRSLSQYLHAQTQQNTVPLQSYTAPAPPPPPPPPQPQPQPTQQPQRHVHWADQQPQPPPVQAIHVPSTQPQPEQKRGPIVVPPRYFPGVPTYTYVPGQGYYHDHTRGGYVIENGQKVYSECEECKKAAEERRKKKESEKGKGKKKKKKGKGEKDGKEGEKKNEDGKGKGGKKGGKKGKDKEKKDDIQGGDTWGGGDQGRDSWGGGGGEGGGDSWGNNNQVDNSGENNAGNNGDNWGDNNNNNYSGGWGDDNNDNNGGNGDNQDNSNGNWDSAPQPAPSPARTTGDPFASGGDPFRSQSHSRSNSRNRNHRDPSPPRSQHGGKPNPILTNPLEDADEFVTPMYRDPVPDEPPLYTVPENIAKERNLTHQVQMGRSLPYFHKIRTPRYLDTLEEPYARFVFKYRRKDVIENMFKVTVERDVEAERKVLEALPREQIVETLLRTHALVPTTTPVKRRASRSRHASRSVSWNLNANNENNANTTHIHNQTHANSSSHTRPQTAHTSPARNDTNSFAGALMDKLSAVSNEQGNWSSNNNNNGNSWDNNNATTSGDPFTSGGGGGGWKGNTAYNSPARPGSPAQEIESQW